MCVLLWKEHVDPVIILITEIRKIAELVPWHACLRAKRKLAKSKSMRKEWKLLLSSIDKQTSRYQADIVKEDARSPEPLSSDWPNLALSN